MWWWKVRCTATEYGSDGVWLRTCHFGWSVKARGASEAQRIAVDTTTSTASSFHGSCARRVTPQVPARLYPVKRKATA